MGTRELFKLQRPDQPRSSLISLVSPLLLPLPPTTSLARRATPVSFSDLPVRVIRLTTRRGGDNYYAAEGGGRRRRRRKRGITAVNPIHWSDRESACKGVKDASPLAFSASTERASESPLACSRGGEGSGESYTLMQRHAPRGIIFRRVRGISRCRGENHKSCRETTRK
jgi:hypothetical protein